MDTKPLPSIECLLELRSHFPIQVTVKSDRGGASETNVWTGAREWCHEQIGPCFNEREGVSAQPHFKINRSAQWGAYGTIFFFDDPDLATMFRITWG